MSETAVLNERRADGAVAVCGAKVTVKATTTYARNYTPTTANGCLALGYLDDGDMGDGKGGRIEVTDIPYSSYTAYIYIGSDGSGKIGRVTVNGVDYPADAADENWTGWGDRATTQESVGRLVFKEGMNYLKIEGLTAKDLSVVGALRDDPSGTRTGLAGLQLVNTGTRESLAYTARLTGTTNWNGGESDNLERTGDAWVNGAANTIEIVHAATEPATLTFDTAVTAAALTVSGSSEAAVTLAKSAETEVQIGTYDFSNAKGEVTVAYDTGSANVLAGANTVLSAAGSGVLSIPAGGKTTLTANETWQGAISYVDDSSVLRIDRGETVMTEIPYWNSANDVAGTIEIAGRADVTSVENGRLVNRKNYRIVGTVTLSALNLGNQGGTQQYLVIDEGGSLTVTGAEPPTSNAASVLLGHWTGNDRRLLVVNGAFTALNAVTRLGWDGSCQVTIGGGDDETATAVMHVRGIKTGGDGRHDGRPSRVTVNANGTLRVGDGGIASADTAAVWQLNGGTLEATDDATISIAQADGLQILSPSEIRIADGKMLTVAAAVTGDAELSFTTVEGGSAVVDLGASRPTAPFVLGDGVTLRISLDDPSETIRLNAPGLTQSRVTVYTNGVEIDPRWTVDETTGVVQIEAPLPVWTAQADASFDNPDNWSTRNVPTEGDVIIDVSGDTTIAVSAAHAYGAVYLRGPGRVGFDFSGDGGLTASAGVHIATETTFVIDGTAKGEEGLRWETAIVGAGRVATRGNVTLTQRNTFAGGLTVETGVLATASGNNGGFGGSGETAKDAAVAVLPGAAVDLANTHDYSYAFTIAGEGVETRGTDGATSYSGALFNSGSEIGINTRQTWKIALSGDATIRAAEARHWGLLANSHGTTRLDLGGHTLTKCGPGSFWLCNATDVSAGTIRVREGTLCTTGYSSTLTGVRLVVEKNAVLQLNAGLSGLASLAFKAGNGGVGFSGVDHYAASNPRPTVDASYVDPDGLAVGTELTLVSDSANGFTNGLFAAVNAGGRFADTVSQTASAVTVTVDALRNFWHYDFDDGIAADTACAVDSRFRVDAWDGEGGSTTTIPSRNGKAVLVGNGYTPYWDGNTAGRSPFAVGCATFVTTIKPVDTDKKVIWGFGNGLATGTVVPNYVALVVDDDQTLSVVGASGTTQPETYATVSGIERLTGAYHFVAVTFTPNGTTLQVDTLIATSDKVFPDGIGLLGQLGNVHGNAPSGYSKQGTAGYWLDDWQAYDAVLTKEELAALRRRYAPTPFFIRVR